MNIFVAGVDEVGRGAIAGPVVSATVILNNIKKFSNIKDSKKLSSNKREEWYKFIIKNSVDFSIAVVGVGYIEKYNIFNASLHSMKLSINKLSVKPDLVLIDGKFGPYINFPCIKIVKGDEIEPVISAASIIAKVTRDKIMSKFSNRFPEYFLDKNKGYLTKKHLFVLKKIGPSLIHRKSFSPVKEYYID